MEDLYLFPDDLSDCGEYDYNIERDEYFGTLGDDVGDWDEDWGDESYDEDAEENEEYWLSNCAMTDDGDCLRAGDEECDFECPFRRGLEERESESKKGGEYYEI